jgi:hypothetical protein
MKFIALPLYAVKTGKERLMRAGRSDQGEER